MNAEWFSIFLVNAVVFSCSMGAAAGQCDLVNKASGESKIEVASKTESLRTGAWMPVEDCSGLKILEGGPVQIRGVVGGVPQKVLCELGKPCSLPPTSRSLVISKTSSYTFVAGGRRMDEAVVLKFGIPRGEVYSLEAAAVFDFSGLSDAPSAFALFEIPGRRQVFQARVTNNKVTIPATYLKRGAKYVWEVYGPRGRGEPLASGGFDLMSKESAAVVTRDLAAQDQGGKPSAAEKMLDELAVYYAHDLTYEISLLRDTLQGKQQ